MDQLKVLDLFAGAGGLSNGFEQTGKFEVKVAVEINENARKTYDFNHDNVKLHTDITKEDFKKKEYRDIDVVIGGPPCQGFSNANRQQNALISSNNQLVKEYIRAIEEIRPKAFVMENVRTMESEKHKFYLNDQDEIEVSNLDIELKKEHLNIGKIISNSDRLKEFLQNAYENKIDLKDYLINQDLMSKLKSLLRHAKKKLNDDLINFVMKESNRNYFAKMLCQWNEAHQKYWDEQYKFDWLELGENIKNLFENDQNRDIELSKLENIYETLNVIKRFSEIIQNKIKVFSIQAEQQVITVTVKSFNIFRFIKAKLSNLGYKFNQKYIFNAANYGVPQERRRLILIGVKEEYLETESVISPEPIFDAGSYFKIHDAIADLENFTPNTDVKSEKIDKISHNPIADSPLNIYLNDSENLSNHVMTDTRDVARRRFESLEAGQNFHDLDDSLKTTYTDFTRTQNTIYKRLDYEKPSDTVVNVRKSMWIHPKKHRAISIREAARLQSFRDSYKFFGTKDSQYQQVGNAVPPLLARAVAEALLESMGKKPDEKLKDILCANEFQLV
jgi:DNA (cytosine-5)-methyltransferase 1